jgi:hypothetical protein
METFIIATITFSGPAYTRAQAVATRADYEAKGHKIEWVEGWRDGQPFWAMGVHCRPREARPSVDYLAQARASLAAVL